MNHVHEADLKGFLQRELDRGAEKVGLHPLEKDILNESSISTLRRRGKSLSDDPIQTVSLVMENGVLRWREGIVSSAGPRRRGARRIGLTGEVLARRKFERLGTSDIPRYLEDLDRSINAAAYAESPLSALTRDGLVPVKGPVAAGRVLLFIHGTFSSFDKLHADLQSDALGTEGREFLSGAIERYEQVLAFDHPTLSVNPALNALDLARLFNGSRADVDVICHSRGGLVARWWMEVLDRVPRRRRAVLVGSPLGGTSLAAPNRLRSALDLMSNIGALLASTAGLIPFLTLAQGLLRILSSIAGLAAKTPLVDAVVAMVPGLAGQSRVSNNLELNRLNVALDEGPDYFIVRGSYEPRDVGLRLWEVFADWKLRAADAAADTLVFPEANDLVVDTASMAQIPLPARATLSYENDPVVHHCSYFRQQRTLAFIREQLGF